MNFYFLLSVIVLQVIPATFGHADYVKSVKQVKGADHFSTERPVMVKFYAPYCGHCNKMIPAYNKLAENLKDLVEVVAVDCTDSSNQNLCGKYRVEGYPTLKFFIVQESESSEKKTMKKKKIVLDYNGDRSTEEMTKFIKYRMHQFIFKVSASTLKSDENSKWNVNFDTFFAKAGNIPKLLLFRSNTNQPPTILFRALSIKYHYKIVIGEVSTKTDSDFASKFNLQSDKVGLIYFPEGVTTKSVIYEGKITREDIFAFLDKQLQLKLSAEDNKVDL